MILVTGATGFVGSELICLLVKKNLNVVGLYRNEIQKNKTIHIIKSRLKKNTEKLKKIKWIKANLKDFSSLENAFFGIKKVYHCCFFFHIQNIFFYIFGRKKFDTDNKMQNECCSTSNSVSSIKKHTLFC